MVIIENADKADLKNAKEMGVSIAKARAIAEYTKQKRRQYRRKCA